LESIERDAQVGISVGRRLLVRDLQEEHAFCGAFVVLGELLGAEVALPARPLLGDLLRREASEPRTRRFVGLGRAPGRGKRQNVVAWARWRPRPGRRASDSDRGRLEAPTLVCARQAHGHMEIAGAL